jgi:hypothetical protein
LRSHRWRARLSPCVAVLTVLIGFVLTSCGSSSTGSGGAVSSTPTPTPTPAPTPNFEKAFSESDLTRLVLQSTEGPTGLPYAPSGATVVSQYWDCCPDVAAAWTGAGFVKLLASNYQSPQATFKDGTTWPSGAGMVFSTVALFHDAAGARQALTAWHGYWSRSKTGVTLVAVKGLGPDAVAFAADPAVPPAGSVTTYIYLWRVGNVVLSMQAEGKTGTYTEADARRLVDVVNARALT